MVKNTKKIRTPIFYPDSEAVNADILERIRDYPDNGFDLACVDPPFGLGMASASAIKAGTKPKSSKAVRGLRYAAKYWDSEPPPPWYFDELRRISKNQIIWGGNHFAHLLPPSNCWVVWDKVTGENDWADVELAWTSFKVPAKLFRFRWSGMLQGNMKDKEERIHPTQKPVALYDWLFMEFGCEGQTVIDTHLGSGSSRIAAAKHKMIFTGFEKEKDYFEDSCERFDLFKAQLTLFG